MAENDMLRRYLDAGMAFTQMTRDRAESIVKDLVKAGELQRSETRERVEELVDRSRKNTEALVDLVRKEIMDQLGAMGLATKDDIARLEARIGGGAAKAVPAAKTPAKASAPKKAATPVKKATKAAVKKGP